MDDVILLLFFLAAACGVFAIAAPIFYLIERMLGGDEDV